MKAAVLESTDKVSVLDVEDPSPSEGEVLVKVHYSGICGSDVQRVLEGRVHGFPIILGHEFSGVVEKVGSGVSEALLGKRVSGIPLIPCGSCPDCEKGYYSLCHHYSFVGSRRNGSMAEKVVLPASNVIEVSDEVTDLEAAFFEPASVGVHAVELAKFQKGSTAIVIGAGTIGLLLAQALVWYGASRVVVANRSAERLETAKGLGLDVVCTRDADWREKALRIISETGFDFVFDTVANSQTIVDSAKLAQSRATVCFVGTPKQKISLEVSEWELLNRKELFWTGSWMSYSSPWPGVEWSNVEKMFAEGAMRVADSMIDAIYPLSETQAAFDRYKDPSSVGGKIVIDSHEGCRHASR